jgi:hypothetical protein
MQKVRAKMKCCQTGQNEDGTFTANFYPVTGGSKENEEFFKWTPGGQLQLSVLKSQYFEAGKEYYIDIEAA